MATFAGSLPFKNPCLIWFKPSAETILKEGWKHRHKWMTQALFLKFNCKPISKLRLHDMRSCSSCTHRRYDHLLQLQMSCSVLQQCHRTINIRKDLRSSSSTFLPTSPWPLGHVPVSQLVCYPEENLFCEHKKVLHAEKWLCTLGLMDKGRL